MQYHLYTELGPRLEMTNAIIINYAAFYVLFILCIGLMELITQSYGYQLVCLVNRTNFIKCFSIFNVYATVYQNIIILLKILWAGNLQLTCNILL